MDLPSALQKIGLYRVKIENGGIYRVRDSAIDFPVEDQKGTRTQHEFKTVAVLSNQDHCDSREEETILVAPMSSDLSIKHKTDVIMRATQGNGLNKDGRVILSHIQPIPKKALEKRFGRFSDEEWSTIVAQLVDNVDRLRE